MAGEKRQGEREETREENQRGGREKKRAKKREPGEQDGTSREKIDKKNSPRFLESAKKSERIRNITSLLHIPKAFHIQRRETEIEKVLERNVNEIRKVKKSFDTREQ